MRWLRLIRSESKYAEDVIIDWRVWRETKGFSEFTTRSPWAKEFANVFSDIKPSGTEIHHLIPQKSSYKDLFRQIGIQMEDLSHDANNLRAIDANIHREITNMWGLMERSIIEQNRILSADDVIDFSVAINKYYGGYFWPPKRGIPTGL